MQITVNGQQQQIQEDATMADLVATLDLGEQRFAVEINQELVPRSTFSEHHLISNDQVEIVRAIGGG